MSFLRTRNILMTELGWSRRVATLATRLANGADTWESIASTPSPYFPLLSQEEARSIRVIGFDTIRETTGSSDTEGAATSVSGARLGEPLHPKFNIKGTQTGRSQ